MANDETPRVAAVTRRAVERGTPLPVAVCARCGRPIAYGRAYEAGASPGTFVHRGPCTVIEGGKR
jgi:hypothetical protein